MKIISSLNGRSMQGFDQDEVRPDRTTHPLTAFELVKDRYHFASGSDPAAAGTAGFKFQSGTASIDGQEIAIETLDIYRDGIVVVCRDTNDSDLVLEDVMAWAVEQFGTRLPAKWPPRYHVSALVVEFDSPLKHLIAKYTAIQGLIASANHTAYGNRLDFQLQRIAFNVDPTSNSPQPLTDYIIERRAGAAFDLERYFSTMPLRTEAHIELLSQIESTLKE